MDQKQRWLPDLVLLEENNGDWECYIECIYQYFHRDFIESLPNCLYMNKNVGQ